MKTFECTGGCRPIAKGMRSSDYYCGKRAGECDMLALLVPALRDVLAGRNIEQARALLARWDWQK